MNIAYLLPIILSAFLSLSPAPPKDNLMLVGQFSIYIDTNAYNDGTINMTWESKIDRKIYKNDCSALFDLYQMKGEICSPAEYLYIQKLFEEYELKRLLSDTTKIKNRI